MPPTMPSAMIPSASTSAARRAPSPQEDARLIAQAMNDQTHGDHEAALAKVQAVIARQPRQVKALLLAGQSELMLERYADCVKTLSSLLSIEPGHAMALSNRGVAHESLGDLAAALKDYNAAVRLEPAFIDALLNQARCLHLIGRSTDSMKAYRAILRQAPHLTAARLGLAEVYRHTGDRQQALEHLQQAVTREPDHGMAWYALGNAHLELQHWDAAVEAYGQASNLLPGHALTYSNCAKALRELKQFDDALLVCEAALAIDPACLPAWRNKTTFLLDLGRWVMAVEACSELLKRRPDDALGHNNLGYALYSLRLYDAALDAFKAATRHDPDFTVAWFNQACTLELMHRYEDVLPCYQQVQRLNPHYPNLLGRMGHARHYVCDWTDSLALRQQITQELQAGRPVCDPFRIITFSDRAQDQRDLARCWLKTLPAPREAWPPLEPPRKRAKIRVGYFSADFHLHATTMLMAELLELHDKSRFELIGFSFGERREDEMKARMRRTFDQFHDVLAQTDDQVAQLARELELDIAVDLKGHTKDGRIGLFRRRMAPVQISYLGYPGTLGVDFMDYIVADAVVIPDELRPYYDEKVIRLPGTYQANDSRRQPDPMQPKRAELGLPDQGFVFCCFNNNYKITPEVFDVWMRLLKATPGSVLWLLSGNAQAETNLRHEATVRGVDPQRLVFAERIPTEQHLARHAAADLFLDTLPCNAHTTASDALRVGLPVLTCTGTSFASRVAASLLVAQGLDDLVTTDLQAYERKALELALDPRALEAVKVRARKAITAGQLLKTTALTRALERGYELAFERALQGLAPDHIDV